MFLYFHTFPYKFKVQQTPTESGPPVLLQVKKYWSWNSSQSFHVKWSLLCRPFLRWNDLVDSLSYWFYLLDLKGYSKIETEVSLYFYIYIYYYMYIRWLKTLRLEPCILIDIWFSDTFFLIRHVLLKRRRSKCSNLGSIPSNPVELVFGSKNPWSAG